VDRRTATGTSKSNTPQRLQPYQQRLYPHLNGGRPPKASSSLLDLQRISNRASIETHHNIRHRHSQIPLFFRILLQIDVHFDTLHKHDPLRVSSPCPLARCGVEILGKLSSKRHKFPQLTPVIRAMSELSAPPLFLRFSGTLEQRRTGMLAPESATMRPSHLFLVAPLGNEPVKRRGTPHAARASTIQDFEPPPPRPFFRP